MREAVLSRKTNETDVELTLGLDGCGVYQNKTGVGFFDHMLDLFAKHAQFDMQLRCTGDVEVDAHHTVEDCGIVLGQAIALALGSKEKIRRYATKFVPMDEALMMASVDVSGRPYFSYHVDFVSMQTGGFDAQLCEEFFRALAMNAGLTLHLNLQYGSNTHHIIEAAFKAVAQALREAISIDESLSGVLSTKGVL